MIQKQKGKRNKNKQELSAKSGAKTKPKMKQVVEFQFTDLEGKIYKAPFGRVKVSEEGGVSCLIKIENGWKAIKAKLDYIKLKNVRVKNVLENKRKRRLPRKST